VLLPAACRAGYQDAEMGEIEEGGTVVVFGAGRVIVVDYVEYRLQFARNFAQCGHIPNAFAERGIKAELKQNPARLARKAAIAALGIGHSLLKRRSALSSLS
jgi:threonine dehydrogenase-like Zn-dependent dehydrogenase